MTQDEQIFELQVEVAKLKDSLRLLRGYIESLRETTDDHDDKLEIIEEILEIDE